MDLRIIRVVLVIRLVHLGGRGQHRIGMVSIAFLCGPLVSGLNVFIAFLTVPMFSLLLSLRNQASYKRKELVRGSVFVFFRLVLG